MLKRVFLIFMLFLVNSFVMSIIKIDLGNEPLVFIEPIDNYKGGWVKCIKYRSGDNKGTIECFKFRAVDKLEKEGQPISNDNFERLEKLYAESGIASTQAFDLLKKKIAENEDYWMRPLGFIHNKTYSPGLMHQKDLSAGYAANIKKEKVIRQQNELFIFYSLTDKSGDVTECTKFISGANVGEVYCNLNLNGGGSIVLPNPESTFNYLESKYKEQQESEE